MPQRAKAGARSAHCYILSKGCLPHPSFSIHLQPMARVCKFHQSARHRLLLFNLLCAHLPSRGQVSLCSQKLPTRRGFLKVYKSHLSVYKEQVSAREGKPLPQSHIADEGTTRAPGGPAHLHCGVHRAVFLTFPETEELPSFASFPFSDVHSGKCKKIFWKYLPINHKGSDVVQLFFT